jgi:hypothetical protein
VGANARAQLQKAFGERGCLREARSVENWVRFFWEKNEFFGVNYLIAVFYAFIEIGFVSQFRNV